MNIITATLETTATLTVEESIVARTTVDAINSAAATEGLLTLDLIEQGFRNIGNFVPALATGWLVYRGGSHVALIKGTERIVLVTERRPEPTPEERVIRYTEALAASLQACTGAVSVTVTDGDQTATVAAPEAPQATNGLSAEPLPAITAAIGHGIHGGWDGHTYAKEPERARIEEQVETINGFALTDLAALRSTLRKLFPGWWFEQEPGLLLMARSKRHAPALICAQALTCAEANIRPGQTFDIHVNQGDREAEVLAVDGRRYLVEYTMPRGTTALQVFTVGIQGGQSVSYTGLTIAWLKALVAADRGWVCNPQTNRPIPSPAAQLALKLTRGKAAK